MGRSRERAWPAGRDQEWIGLSGAFAIGLASPAAPSRADSVNESPSEAVTGAQAESTPAFRDWEIEIQPCLRPAKIDGEVDTGRFGRRHFSACAQDVLKGLDLGVMGSARVHWERLLVLVDVAGSEVSERDGIGGDLIRYDVTQRLDWPRNPQG